MFGVVKNVTNACLFMQNETTEVCLLKELRRLDYTQHPMPNPLASLWRCLNYYQLIVDGRHAGDGANSALDPLFCFG